MGKYSDLILNDAPVQQEQPSAQKKQSYADMVLSPQSTMASRDEMANASGSYAKVLGTTAVTGEGRETRATQELPEIIGSGIFTGEDDAKVAKIKALLAVTPDAQKMANIISSTLPNIGITQDEKGNIIANNNKTGVQAIINKPGLSKTDALNLTGLGVAFTPAGRAGLLATTTAGKMAAVAGASGATELALQVAQQAGGATENISLMNIDPKSLAAATVGGGAFEGISIGFRNIARSYKQKGLTQEIKNEFKAQMQSMGIDPKQVTDDYMNSYFNSANEAIDQTAAQGVKASQEFNIRMTKGQVSQNQKQLNLEDSLRHGRLGPKGQEVMQRHGNATADDVRASVAKEQAALSGGKSSIETPMESGGLVKEGIKAKEVAAGQAVNDAYGQVGNASLKPEGVRALNTRLLRVAKVGRFDTGEGFEQSTKTLKELQAFDLYAKEGNKVGQANLRQLDGFRQRLGSRIAAASNQSDKRQLVILKQELDRSLDNAVDRHLFNGDDDALAQLKEARGLRAEYAKQFQRVDAVGKKTGRKFKDDAGDVIERIINADPTDTEVVNYMFGASKFASKQAGGKIAARVKGIVGEGSKEWQSVREAAFMRLTQPNRDGVVSGRLFANRLDDALENPTLMRELFTNQEIGRMRWLAATIKRTQPNQVNPSGTANALAQTVNQMWENLVTTIGLSTGGPIGAVAARQGAKAGTSLRAFSKASNSIGEHKVFQAPKMGPTGAVTGVLSSDALQSQNR